MAGSGSDYDWNDHNRRIVAEGQRVLERTSASIARSNQIAIETEEVGTQVRKRKLNKNSCFIKNYLFSGDNKSRRTKRIVITQST